MNFAKLQFDWNDLRFFLAVARGRSLNAAARLLGVNHSTVFRRINRFETAVGVRLFERLVDGYHLTQAGEELQRHAQRVNEEIDALQLKLLGRDFQPSGTIRLTAPDNIAYAYLPQYLRDFSNDYPDIQIELLVGAESLDLTRREADVAIRATPKPPPHLIGRKACSLPWSFYASRDYLQRIGAPASALKLRGHKLIGADDPLLRLPVFRRLAEQHGSQIVMTCSTLNAMSAMCEAGIGIALLPADQEKSSLERLFACKPAFASELWLLTHPELRQTERIRLLMAQLHRAFRKDPRLLKRSAAP